MTQGQGERKCDQEKTQALRESGCARAPVPGCLCFGQLARLRALGWGSSLPSPTPSPDSEESEADRVTQSRARRTPDSTQSQLHCGMCDGRCLWTGSQGCSTLATPYHMFLQKSTFSPALPMLTILQAGFQRTVSCLEHPNVSSARAPIQDWELGKGSSPSTSGKTP